jgi:putative transposase
MNKRLTEAQIVGFLRATDAGLPVKDAAGSMGSRRPAITFGEASFGGMSVSDAKRLKELEIRKQPSREVARGLASGERGDA